MKKLPERIPRTISYQEEDGTTAVVTFGEGPGTPSPTEYQINCPTTLNWTTKREAACRLIAAGVDPTDAVMEAYGIADAISAAHTAGWLLKSTDAKLRIHQLRQPVKRIIKEKLEYTLQKALEECQTAYDLAYIDGNVNGMLKAVELRTRLVKLLGAEEINVTHRYGLLDDASTDVLLAMKAEIEAKRAKRQRPVTALVVQETPA